MEARTCSTADDNSVDSAFLPDPPDGSGNYCDTDTALQAAPTARKLLPLPMPDPSSHLVSTRLRHSFKESSHSSLPADMLSTPHPHEGTARWRELGCVYIALIADAITANIIAPYAQDWVRDTYHVNNIGLYSGVLIGGVQFARALSSPFFGWISDSMGRRLLMAGGLLTAGCLTMAGGLSKNFWMCFGFRFLAGILNPCEVVATAAIGDLATGRARTVAFGYSKAASQVAKILTSMIGGFTYNLAPNPLFRRFPGYQTVLFSHLIALGSCLSAVVFIFVFYREGPNFSTRLLEEEYEQQEKPGGLGQGGEEDEGGRKGDEENATLQMVHLHGQDGTTAAIAVTTNNQHAEEEEDDEDERNTTIRPPTLSTPHDFPHTLPMLDDEPTLLAIAQVRCHCWPSPALLRPSSSLPSSFAPSSSVFSSSSQGGLRQRDLDALVDHTSILPRGASTFTDRPSLGQGVMYVISSPLLVRLILVYSLTSFLNGGLFLSINLLALASWGYDMQPRECSIIMLLFGCWATFFNACLFKPVVRHLGSKRANAVGLIATGVGVLGLPLADMFVPSHSWPLWGCIVSSVLVFGSGYMLVNGLLVGFISSHASADMQGITQGLAVFLSSSLSGIGPVVLGLVANAALEAKVPVLSFLFLSVGYFVAFLALKDVPREVLEAEG